MSKRHLGKFKIVLTSVMVCGLFFTGCGDKKELNSYEQGVLALENQQYKEALNSFKAMEENAGRELRLVYRGEGLAYMGLGEYEKALEAFDLSLKQSNGLIKKIDYDTNFYMAVAECKSGKLDDAITTYTNIINVDENNADAYYLRGKVNLDLSKIDEAKSDFDKAIELDKNNSKLYINIHDDLLAHGNESDAKAYISLGVANVSKPSTYELGIFNYYLGDYTQARNYFEESSETKKTEEGIIYLGKTYVALDDSSYAIALYDEFTNNNKTAAMVYNEIGLLKAENKDYDGALAAFSAGIDSGDAVYRQTLMYNRIVAYEFLGNFSEAKKQMQSYLELYPDDKNAKREQVFLSSR